DRRAAARQRGKLRGLGIANPIEVAGGPYTSVNPDTAEVRVNADGSVTVFAGSTSMGQGNATAFAQIVSERLGVPPARIRVLWGDSDALGAGRGNGGSGAMSVGGSAVLRATDKVIERGRRIAAAQLEAAPEDVVFRDGKFTVTGTVLDYAMPRADDLPAFEVDSFEVPTKVNPLGAKGVGEAGTVGALAALLNAVNDALAPLGIRHLDMPVTPERVWRAMREARR